MTFLDDSNDSNGLAVVSIPAAQRGFTLIELLMVIAILAILSGLSFGVFQGIQSAQNRAQAKAELSVLAQALELFKSANGDYPITNDVENDDNGVVLSKSLLGWKEFVAGSPPKFKDKTNVPSSGPKSYIDLGTFFTSGTMPESINKKPTNLILLDPWGNPYVYAYKESSAWSNFGYVLYSAGTDGVHESVSADGVMTATIRNDANNADNIYAGE
ncbi:MAG: general secretion pathway protein G [Lentimonas sp.]|jgi:prepilin-type N-terminal cleavage/methylation domain-containing protein